MSAAGNKLVLDLVRAVDGNVRGAIGARLSDDLIAALRANPVAVLELLGAERGNAFDDEYREEFASPTDTVGRIVRYNAWLLPAITEEPA